MRHFQERPFTAGKNHLKTEDELLVSNINLKIGSLSYHNANINVYLLFLPNIISVVPTRREQPVLCGS